MINIRFSGFLLHNNKILLLIDSKTKKWRPLTADFKEDSTPDEELIIQAQKECNLKVLPFPISPITDDESKNLAVPFDVKKDKNSSSIQFYYLLKSENIEEMKQGEEILAIKWISEDSCKSIANTLLRKQCEHIFSLLKL